jgi:hypothetical protein
MDLAEDFKALRTMALDRSKLAWSIYAEDPERAARLLTEAQLIISKAPLSNSKKLELTKLVGRPTGASFVPTLRTLVDHDKKFAAEFMKNMLGKENQ